MAQNQQQSRQQHPGGADGLQNAMSGMKLDGQRGPPSLRPKRSQRFTVTPNQQTSGTEPPPVPTLQAPGVDRVPSASYSASSVSDTDSNPDAPRNPSTPAFGSTLNPLAAPVQPFQSQNYHMAGAVVGAPFMTPPSSKGKTGGAGYGNVARPGQWVDANGPAPGPGHIQPPQVIAAEEEDIIPTAIVIKNIPFSVRREQLLAIIEDLMIPPPYAFNYHFDNGVFRGLAFANFRSPSEADSAVAGLNGFDISGRKLRVEYKKVLQAGEKERIEKEKAIKRMRSMQMQKEQEQYAATGGYSPARSREPSYHEEDYGEVVPGGQFMGSASPGAGFRNLAPPPPPNFNLSESQGSPPSVSGTAASSDKASSKDLDMNDPQTLEIYSRVLLFKDDPMRDSLAFARSLSATQRRIVHQVAKKLGLEHRSEGQGDERHVVVHKGPAGGSKSRQGTVGRSGGYLSPEGHTSGLRGKKSMPDMRSGGHPQGGGPYDSPSRSLGRRSNVNLREGYATTGRKASSGRGDAHMLFGNQLFHSAPPVPPFPDDGRTSPHPNPFGPPSPGGGVLRQPRGPPEGGRGFNENWRAARMGTGPTVVTSVDGSPTEV